MCCLGHIVMGKKSCNRLADWSICFRPAWIFSVANNMKCHIKVILAISVVKVKNKVKDLKGKDFRSWGHIHERKSLPFKYLTLILTFTTEIAKITFMWHFMLFATLKIIVGLKHIDQSKRLLQDFFPWLIVQVIT